MGIIQKKIAVLCNYELLADRVGGMDYFFWQFDAKCKENNIEVDWFFPNHSVHGGYSSLTIFESKYQNVENFFLDFSRKNKVNYAHVITHFIELCTPFFYKIKQLISVNIIAVDHNPRPLGGYTLKKRVEKKLKGVLFSRYIDLFVGVSNYTVNELKRDFGNRLKNKTITIYNGVVIADIKSRVTRNTAKPTFLVASHLRESKGIQDLIQAVSQFPQDIKKDIYIAIYGDGPYKHKLIELAKYKKVMGNFRFMGSHSNLKEIYCNYDYMLQPTHMECFSLSILESLAANVPVITTTVGGNEEVVTNNKNGFLTEAKDIYSLQNIIKMIYLGDVKITTNTRKLIEEAFSLERMVDNHFRIIQ